MKWKAIIVGHGPSMTAERMGPVVDAHDVVIRLKPTAERTLEHPSYYGTKTHIVGSSLHTLTQVRGLGGAREYWGWSDSRHDEGGRHHAVLQKLQSLEEWFTPYRLLVDVGMCREADEEYRRRLGDEQGEPHLSQGMKAVVCALGGFLDHIDSMTALNLIGFDNLLTGNFTWSVTRGPQWEHYPNHRWDIERDMLRMMMDEEPRLSYLMPETFPEGDV